MPTSKIVTCCYCGTRAALVLQGKVRHELSCSNCGAPLHDLKMIPREDVGKKRELLDPWSSPSKQTKGKTPARKAKKKKLRKKRKSFAQRAFEEVFDVIEDILD